MKRSVAAFLEDIFNVFEKHNMSISHEDVFGSFKIEDFNYSNVETLKEALDQTTTRQGEREE